MGIEQRRQRERDEVREKILDAARELFVECGYEGVSMRKVAERIEYSPTTIYLYFADKETLFQQLCQGDFARLAEEFQQVARLADPVERLRESARIYIRFAVAHPNHYRLMFMTPHKDWVAPAKTECNYKGNPNEDAYAFLRANVSAAVERGAFQPAFSDPDLISQTLWAAVHGVASLEITNKSGSDEWVHWTPLDARSQAMLDSIMHGLLKPEAESGAKPRSIAKREAVTDAGAAT